MASIILWVKAFLILRILRIYKTHRMWMQIQQSFPLEWHLEPNTRLRWSKVMQRLATRRIYIQRWLPGSLSNKKTLRISITARYYSYPLREVQRSLPLCNRKTNWNQMVQAATSHFWSKRVPHSLQIWPLIITSTARVNRGSAGISTNSTTSSYLHRYITHRYTVSNRW